MAWNASIGTMAHAKSEKARSRALQCMQEEQKDRQHAMFICRAWDKQLILAGIGGLATFKCASTPPAKLVAGQKRSLEATSVSF
eukprot:2448517-Amphidinium_carterae.1